MTLPITLPFAVPEAITRAASFPMTALKVLTEAGLVRPMGPLTFTAVLAAYAAWGPGLAGGMKSAALRFPDRLGLIDDLGELTYRELDQRGNAVADSLKSMGIHAGDSVAIMVRNHRGFFDISVGAAKVGADTLFLNTAFAAPQLADVLERERPALLVYDEEFADVVALADIAIPKVLAWVEDNPEGLPTVEGLVNQGSTRAAVAPSEPSRLIILTSGTTGTPKGARRGNANLGAAVALLSKLPLRSGGRSHIPAPLFHTWGWAHLGLSMLLGSTVVVTRFFDPRHMLDVVERHRCDCVAVVPIMLQRTLQLPDEVLAQADLSWLTVVASSGSALPGNVALEWMDRFGDCLYNTYGSTEVAWVSIATPEDLRAAPTCAGRPPVGTQVRIMDQAGHEVARGHSGRIFVGNSMLFDGYTGGDSKHSIDGLMSSGDVGRFDSDGRLYVEGRDDDMIISGGENVFPQEVEDVLAKHPDVIEAAAIGVEDADFGQRLRAFVVLTEGAHTPEQVLKDHVRDHLARYKVPREVVYVSELPRNSTGKILKRELHQMHEENR